MSRSDIASRIRSLTIADGATQLIRTPHGATSMAMWRVIAMTPALAAAYATLLRAGWRAAAEAIVTIAPRPRAIMSGRNVRMERKVDVRFASSAACQRSSESDTLG